MMMIKAKSVARRITGCCLLLAAAASGGQHPRDLFQPVIISEEPAVLTELRDVFPAADTGKQAEPHIYPAICGCSGHAGPAETASRGMVYR